MIVTFISECEKKSLNKTCRVLDAFANRIGRRTWQTVITQEGLNAVKKLLRQTATKNTAVSCFWIRSRSRTELVWIVGQRGKFNEQGDVPVNHTKTDIMKNHIENTWHNTDVIALLSSIAGLFHDFGKANALFQNKLNPKKKTKNYEPYRHEWISLRLFQAFVYQRSDQEWLQALQNIRAKDELTVLKRLHKDNPDDPSLKEDLFSLAPIAKVVAWLIVSHHRLPVYPNNSPDFKYIDQWQRCFGVEWNSANHIKIENKKVLIDNWHFPNGTPILSQTWRERARSLATRALACQRLSQQDWFNSRFTAHLSRLCLMLSDHYYSASDKTTKWQDKAYQNYANTKDKKLHQQLDEHNIGVAFNAYLLARKLPRLKADLPHLGYDRKFSQKTIIDKFRWQNKASDLAQSLNQKTARYGFFGINMASTGLGKTLANAKIMIALAGDKKGSRFNVALGLRTLTLQTADAFHDNARKTSYFYCHSNLCCRSRARS